MEFTIAFTNNFKHGKVASENNIALSIKVGLHWRAPLVLITSVPGVTSILWYKKKNLWGNSAQNMITYDAYTHV